MAGGRARTRYWFSSSSILGVYEVGVMKQDSRGFIRPLSSNKLKSPVKIPFGPVSNCEFVQYSNDSGDIVGMFELHNEKNLVTSFDACMLDNLRFGANPFTQKITSLSLAHKNLLAIYLARINYCECFIYHEDSIHDKDGLPIANYEEVVCMITKAGGSLVDYREFVNLAKTFSTHVEQSTESNRTSDEDTSRSSRKRKPSDGKNDNDVSKKSKWEQIVFNETTELTDNDGFEVAYLESHSSASHIPLSNISIPEELEDEICAERVKSIQDSMLKRYCPALSVLVVCQVDESKDIKDLTQQFYVVEKMHCFKALEALKEAGKFQSLPGHFSGKVLCFVLKSNRPDLMQYGSARSHMVKRQFSSRMTSCQDLLHQFHCLTLRCKGDENIDCLRAIERIAKASCIGPDELTALKKLFRWSPTGRQAFMLVLKKYESYLTCDVISKGHQQALARSSKLRLNNSVLRMLSKVTENYFLENYKHVLCGELSLKSLAERFKEDLEVMKVHKTLSAIAGSDIDILKSHYPGKFDVSKIKSFIGAVWNKNSKNHKGLELEKYFETVVLSEKSDNVPLPVQLISYQDIKYLFNEDDLVKKFDFVVYIMSQFDKDLISDVVLNILQSDQHFHGVVMVFNSEADYLEVRSYLQSKQTCMIRGFRMNSLLFKVAPTVESDVIVNVKFGILFGIIPFMRNSIFVHYDSLNHLESIVDSVSSDRIKVAVVTDPGVPIIKIHSAKFDKLFSYYGSTDSIAKFKKYLAADRKNIMEKSHSSIMKKSHSSIMEESHTSNMEESHTSIMEESHSSIMEESHSSIMEESHSSIMEKSHSSESVYDFEADGDENIPSTSNTPRKIINESTDSGYQVNRNSLDASRSLLDSIIESVS